MKSYIFLAIAILFSSSISFSADISTCQDFPISLHLDECDTLEASFERIWKWYVYNNSSGKIYFQGLVLSTDSAVLLDWAKLDDFKILHIDYWTKTVYAKDANHLYKNGLILEGYDRESFEIVYGVFAKDKNYVYDRNLRIIEFEWVSIDPRSFELISSGIIKDKNGGYYFDLHQKIGWNQYGIEKIEWINIAKLVPIEYGYFWDWLSVYYQSARRLHRIGNVDLSSFKVLWWGLVKDKNWVYHRKYNDEWVPALIKIDALSPEWIEIKYIWEGSQRKTIIISNNVGYLYSERDILDLKQDELWLAFLKLDWVDIDSLEFIDSEKFSDKNWIYTYSYEWIMKISETNIENFIRHVQLNESWRTIVTPYYSDSVTIYSLSSYSQLNKEIDAWTREIVYFGWYFWSEAVFSRDKNNLYFHPDADSAITLKKSDPNDFEVYKWLYILSNWFIYYKGYDIWESNAFEILELEWGYIQVNWSIYYEWSRVDTRDGFFSLPIDIKSIMQEKNDTRKRHVTQQWEEIVELPGYLCSSVCPDFLMPVFYTNDLWDIFLYWKKISIFTNVDSLTDNITHEWVSNWIVKIILDRNYYISEDDKYHTNYWERYTFTDEYIDKIDNAVAQNIVSKISKEKLELVLDANIKQTSWYWYWTQSEIIVWTFYRHIRRNLDNYYK